MSVIVTPLTEDKSNVRCRALLVKIRGEESDELVYLVQTVRLSENRFRCRIMQTIWTLTERTDKIVFNLSATFDDKDMGVGEFTDRCIRLFDNTLPPDHEIVYFP